MYTTGNNYLNNVVMHFFLNPYTISMLNIALFCQVIVVDQFVVSKIENQIQNLKIFLKIVRIEIVLKFDSYYNNNINFLKLIKDHFRLQFFTTL